MKIAVALFSTVALIGAALPLVAPEKPDPNEIPQHDVRAVMERVERILAAQGFPMDGFAESTPPRVHIVPCDGSVSLKNCGRSGAWLFQQKRIEISDREPYGCHGVTLAYELTRYAAERQGITKGFADRYPQTLVGGILAMAAETDLAKGVAAIVATEDFLLNCISIDRLRGTQGE